MTRERSRNHDDRPSVGASVAAILAVVLVACSGVTGPPTFPFAGHAVAGPTCPVEPASPAPGQCEPRPVAGATLVVTDGSGREVLRTTSSQDGAFASKLPAGAYTLRPQPMAGLMGVAPPITFSVSANQPTSNLTVQYDTGIR